MGTLDGNPNIQKAYEAILQHDFEQATVWFERAIAEEPDNASYHYRLSITFARSNAITKAIAHAKQACMLEPASEPYRLHLNTLNARQLLYTADDLLSDQGAPQLHEAIDMLKQACRLDPLSAEALLILAVAYERRGWLKDALDTVEEALKLEPQHQEANALYEHLRRSNMEK